MSDTDMSQAIYEARQRIERNGGRVGSDKNIHCSNPGIKVLGAIDCLVNYGGYKWRKR